MFGDAMADYGRFRTTVGAVVGVIIALIFIVVGLLYAANPFRSVAKIAITKIRSCHRAPVTYDQNGQVVAEPLYDCIVDVDYTTSRGKKVSVKSVPVTHPTPLYVGGELTLRYEPNNPQDVKQEANPDWGYAIAGFGLLIGLLSVGLAEWSYENRTVAQVEGAIGIYDLARTV